MRSNCDFFIEKYAGKDTTERSFFSDLAVLVVKQNGALSEANGYCTYANNSVPL